MNGKRLFIVLIVILIILIIVLAVLKWRSKEEVAIQTEITPLEEITDEQERQTMISLYFINPESNTLVPEARRVDAKTLLENPYKVMVELLIEGPKNDKLVASIPGGTKVNNAELKNSVVVLDLSKEFIDNQTGDAEIVSLSIYSIVNTLTELNEVNCVKILIDGEENIKFNNMDLSLEGEFIRKD